MNCATRFNPECLKEAQRHAAPYISVSVVKPDFCGNSSSVSSDGLTVTKKTQGRL